MEEIHNQGLKDLRKLKILKIVNLYLLNFLRILKYFIYIENLIKFFSIPVKYDIDENSSIQIFSVKKILQY